MRNFIIWLFFMGTVGVFAQSNPGSSTGDKSYLPNITPPSPEAFNVIEYGKNNISETPGKLNLSIPIYNFTAGKLTLPISLNYSGAGVKVDDISSWTGINWNLSMGVISRRIVDSPDESTLTTRVIVNKTDMLVNAINTCTPNSQFYQNLCQNKDMFDTEYDIFSYSFNGISGTFYLDNNFNPVSIDTTIEIKIEVVGNSSDKGKNLREQKMFLITTTDGVKYYFGGAATESTLAVSGKRDSSIVANSSFFLFKIVHPISGTINFDYNTFEARRSFMSRSYKTSNDPRGTNSLYYVNPATTETFVLLINNPLYLKKISSPDTNIEIDFDSELLTSIHFVAKLNSIAVKKNNVLYNKINFKYSAKTSENQMASNFNTATRFFLNKVEINKDFDVANNKHEEYTFEYEDPFGLPSRLSNSQDILGYYNGKINQTLIPDCPLTNPGHSPIYGDRSPNFILAKKGSLIRITYPTKGYSVFEYEDRPAKEKIYKKYFRTAVYNQPATIPGYDELTEEYETFTPVYDDQEVEVKIKTNCSAANLYLFQANHAVRVQLNITDTNDQTLSKSMTFNIGQNPSSRILKFKFVKNHIYNFELKFVNVGLLQSTAISSSIEIVLFNGYKKVEGFGVRIKSQKGFTDNMAASTNYFRYYYGRITLEDDALLHLPEISYFPKYIYEFDQGSTGYGSFKISFMSEPSNKYCDGSNGEFNDIVSTSYGGDNFENGGTEKYFWYDSNNAIQRLEYEQDSAYCTGAVRNNDGSIKLQVITSLQTPNNSITVCRDNAKSFEQSNYSTYNGKIIGERTFINKNGALFKANEKSYDYFEHDTHDKINFVGRLIFGAENVGVYCSPAMTDPMRMPVSSCYMGYYYMDTRTVKLNGVYSTNYIDPIPMTYYQPMTNSNLHTSFQVDQALQFLQEAPFRKIVTNTVYTYGTLRSLPTEIKTTTSDNAKFAITKNIYPTDLATSLSATSLDIVAASKLVAQNRIATPVIVEQYSNNDLLSTQKTKYNVWNNNPEMVLPSAIQVSKGSAMLEDRAFFEEYDVKGNPTIVSLKDGIKTKYYYNTLNQVVMKIENYQSSFNIPANPTLVNPCSFIAQYPSTFITIFEYDIITNLLSKITDPKCETISYEYDALHRLKNIKDQNNNIVKTFDNNYKP